MKSYIISVWTLNWTYTILNYPPEYRSHHQGCVITTQDQVNDIFIKIINNVYANFWLKKLENLKSLKKPYRQRLSVHNFGILWKLQLAMTYQNLLEIRQIFAKICTLYLPFFFQISTQTKNNYLASPNKNTYPLIRRVDVSFHGS